MTLAIAIYWYISQGSIPPNNPWCWWMLMRRSRSQITWCARTRARTLWEGIRLIVGEGHMSCKHSECCQSPLNQPELPTAALNFFGIWNLPDLFVIFGSSYCNTQFHTVHNTIVKLFEIW